MSEASLTLHTPHTRFEVSFLALADDFIQSHGNDTYGKRYRNLKATLREKGFAAYVNHLQEQEVGVNLLPGYVSNTTYWLIENEVEVAGLGNFRHRLTPALEHFGGHIGYEIRPSRRRRGYGSIILALLLEKIRPSGLARVLLTCDPENEASRRIIVKHGGQLIDTIWLEEYERHCMRFWIDL